MLLTIICLLGTALACWLCLAQVLMGLQRWRGWVKPFPGMSVSLRHTDVILIVAHPDDESMFFAPTVLSLALIPRVNIHVLCLSTGNAFGQGGLRKQELLNACNILGVPGKMVEIIDHPKLQDGFQQDWCPADLLPILRKKIAQIKPSVVLSFDCMGVSGHPNHIAVHQGLRCTMAEAEQGDSPQRPQYWQLTSENTLLKFVGPFTAVLRVLQSKIKPNGQRHVYLNPAPLKCFHAMRAHSSQWVWFRWLFVTFASYTYVNTLISFDEHAQNSAHLSCSNDLGQLLKHE